jgi:thioredoxin 1
MAIEPISEASFDEKVSQAAQPVVIDFWLANCPPCQTLEPKIAAVAQAFAGRVKVYRLDVEKSPSISDRYDVMSVPTLVFFRGGRAVKRLDGLITQQDLESAFNEVGAS